jgi:hypothetical protein
MRALRLRRSSRVLMRESIDMSISCRGWDRDDRSAWRFGRSRDRCTATRLRNHSYMWKHVRTRSVEAALTLKHSVHIHVVRVMGVRASSAIPSLFPHHQNQAFFRNSTIALAAIRKSCSTLVYLRFGFLASCLCIGIPMGFEPCILILSLLYWFVWMHSVEVH